MGGIIPVFSSLLLMAAPAVSLAQTGFISHSYSIMENSAGTAGPVPCLDDLQPRGNVAPATSQIAVNAGQPVRMADARWFGIGTPIWDNYLDTPQSVTLLSKMGTQALRFPGGSVADAFHWYNNLNCAGNFPYGTTVANFIRVVTNLNAEAMITVNYGTGNANEAAAWVAYVNATTNNPQYLGVDSTGYDWQTAGYWASLRASAPLAMDDGMNFLRISRAAPLGFKYWEIGNENYGWWETDVNYLSHDPYTYAVRSQAYISLMKAVDPTVKIGVVASPGANSYVNYTYHPAVDPVTGQTYNGWTPVVLATLASLNVTPDFAIMHDYAEYPGHENDAILLSEAATGWATNAADLRRQINDYLGSKGTNVELICTENNADVSIPGKQSVSLVTGLYKADTLGQLMQTEFNGLFWHDFRDNYIEMVGNMDPALYGWRLYGDFGVASYTDVYPTFYTSELVQHFAQGGDMVVAANSDHSLLSVYAVRRQNGSLTMLAVNKDPVNTNTAQVSVAGFTPASGVAVYSYGIPQDTAAETGIGSPDIFQTNISVTGTSFSYAFPPYSATVLVLSPALSSSPSTTTVASSQNPALAGSSVTLTATVSGNGGIPSGYVVFKDGATNLGIGTLNSSGMASATTLALSAGGSPHSITAVYGGDGSFAGNTSSALSEIITNKAGVSTNGLSASWPFYEGSGATVADSSGNGNTGTLNDSPVWAAGLNGGNALKFPGALVPGAAYISAPDSATLGDQGIGSNITICAWVKRSPDSIGHYCSVVAKDTPFDTFPYHRNYELIFDMDSHILFVYRNSAGSSWEMYASSRAFADTGNWHYFCVTYTYGAAASCALYVDGAAVPGGWVAGNGSDAPATTGGGPVLIGIDGLGSASYGSLYKGISIYSVLLPAPQVLALYNSGISTGAGSATALASSQNPAPGGSVVTFTATVTGSGGTPTGTVAFYDGTDHLGSGSLDSSGVTSLSTSALSASGSPHSITAVYGGDGTFGGSTSGELSQVITNSGTSTSSGGLIASWPFNEGAGTAVADSSGNGNTGTLCNSPLWVSGLAGCAALEFPGVSMPGGAYVTVPNSATLADQAAGSQITICAWVKRSSASLGDYCSVVAKDVLNDSPPYHRNYEMIFDTGGHLLFVYRNSAGTSWEMYASSAAYTDTANWHFYCVTYTYGSAASCALYVDGAPVSGGWVVGNGSDAPASTSGGPVLIGTDGTRTASHGSIYEGISIYNTILSASQVLGLFDSGIAPGIASTTAVTSSQNPAAAGSTVTFTATVGGSGGTPTGTVVFYDGTDNLGSGSLNSSGVTSLSTSALSAIGSPHSITAVYGGDGTFGGSTSGELSQVITNSSTSTSSGGLIASWPFNEGAGTAVADSSGNGNTGTLEDSPLWVAGLAGRAALEFSGVSMPGGAYVSVPNSATLADQAVGSQITICAWVKRSPDSLGNYCSVVAKDVLNDSPPYHRNYEMIFDTGGHILFVYRNSAGTSWEMYASSAVFTDTENWHFYCVTYTYGSAASCTLYVDGTPVSGGWIAGNGSDAPASTSGGPVLIGTDGTRTASHGSIYEGISIYNTILSASQVLGLFDSGIAPGVASTTAVTSSQNPAVAGSTVTFTATVGGSGGTPTGTVAFYDGTDNLGSGSLDSSGVASLSTSTLSVSGSPHSITAAYGGDSTFGGSTSGELSQIITGSSGAVSIPLVNASFEVPAGAQGTVAGAPAGWLPSNQDPCGVYNPAVGLYKNEINDILPSPAQGSQVLYIQGGNYVAQFLTNTLAPNQTCTLSGAIGNRGDGYGLLGSDTEYVCLLAGGTILAQNANLPHPAPGTFLSWAISYTTGAAGFPSGTLEIRLGQSGAGQVQYDNIALTSTSSASQAAAALLVDAPSTAPQIMTGDASFGFLTGQFGFNVGGVFGQTVVVDGSTNLVDWTPLFTNSAGGVPFWYRDAAPGNFAWRFYRARLP